MKSEFLYIKTDKKTVVSNKRVLMRDVVKVYSPDKKMVNEIIHMELLNIKQEKKANYIFSVLKVIEKISEKYPDVEVINEGENEFIIYYEPVKSKSKVLDVLKTIIVSLIVFFGSAFAIMTFNTDAEVFEVFDVIYRLFMGVEKEGGTILEISYSIGLPLGIIVFYSHFSKAKLGKDPSPMQVQMRLYEEDIDMAVIENGNREGKMIDVN